MTTITYISPRDDVPFTRVKVNGKSLFVDRIRTIKKIGPGRWVGVYELRQGEAYRFEIEGGREAGGGRTDWFLTSEHVGTLRCRTAREAVREIENL